MLGYCSNSPGRCELAKELTLIDAPNKVCPSCGFALTAPQPTADATSPRFNNRSLNLVIIFLSLALLIFSYTYFLFTDR